MHDCSTIGSYLSRIYCSVKQFDYLFNHDPWAGDIIMTNCLLHLFHAVVEIRFRNEDRTFVINNVQ